MERTKFSKKTGFGQIFDTTFQRCPDREAIVYGNWRISYRQLERLIYQTAHFLEAQGLRKGDRAAIISRNCPEFLIAEFAMYRLGIIPVKFNWRLTPEEMIYMLDYNGTSYVFLRMENPEDDRLFYYDANLPRPDWKIGEMLTVTAHDKSLGAWERA